METYTASCPAPEVKTKPELVLLRTRNKPTCAWLSAARASCWSRPAQWHHHRRLLLVASRWSGFQMWRMGAADGGLFFLDNDHPAEPVTCGRRLEPRPSLSDRHSKPIQWAGDVFLWTLTGFKYLLRYGFIHLCNLVHCSWQFVTSL